MSRHLRASEARSSGRVVVHMLRTSTARVKFLVVAVVQVIRTGSSSTYLVLWLWLWLLASC